MDPHFRQQLSDNIVRPLFNGLDTIMGDMNGTIGPDELDNLFRLMGLEIPPPPGSRESEIINHIYNMINNHMPQGVAGVGSDPGRVLRDRNGELTFYGFRELIEYLWMTYPTTHHWFNHGLQTIQQMVNPAHVGPAAPPVAAAAPPVAPPANCISATNDGRCVNPQGVNVTPCNECTNGYDNTYTESQPISEDDGRYCVGIEDRSNCMDRDALGGLMSMPNFINPFTRDNLTVPAGFDINAQGQVGGNNRNSDNYKKKYKLYKKLYKKLKSSQY